MTVWQPTENACLSWKSTVPNTPLCSNNRHGELTRGGSSGSREAESNCPDSLHWPSIHWIQLSASRPSTSTGSAKQMERPLFLLFVYAVGMRKMSHFCFFRSDPSFIGLPDLNKELLCFSSIYSEHQSLKKVGKRVFLLQKPNTESAYMSSIIYIAGNLLIIESFKKA